MEHDYTIEALISKFAEDATKYDEWLKEDKLNHPLDNNDKDLEKFNISRALAVICCEIERLKHKL